MAVSALNFTLIKTPNTRFSDAQIFLQEFTGNSFSKEEADVLWTKILDHKWNMSERLRRDVGLRVATIDYVEHFYRPAAKRPLDLTAMVFDTVTSIGRGIRAYFEAKSKYSVL